MLDTAALNALLGSVIETAKSNGKLWILVAALTILLRRRALANKTKLISDLRHVGHASGESSSFKDEFDVIIIGGGEFYSRLTLPTWHVPFKQVPLDVYLLLEFRRTRLYASSFSNPVAGQ